MTKITPKILKGFRDFLPEKKAVRENIINVVKKVYESFGFLPLETPAIEYAETLLGKYGDEADKLVYRFQDCGGREVSLRYDLTVPLARAMAMYPELTKPFKRYQVALVWRAEKPQKGRFREFTQCDVDIVGASSLMADAEIIAVIYSTMRALGFSRFVIKINNRKILNGLISILGMDENQVLNIFRILDKFDKIGVEGIQKEFMEKGFKTEVAEKILGFIQTKGSNQDLLSGLKIFFAGDAEGLKGVGELEYVLGCLSEMGIPKENLEINLTIVRGLDYYSGTVFETIVSDLPGAGSVFSGGRYDNLIGMFCEKAIPAVGVSLGIDRVVTVMEELKMLPSRIVVSRVLVTVFDRTCREQSLKTASAIRKAGVNTEIYLKEESLAKQISYAYKKEIPFVVIIGPEEIKADQIIIKDLKSGRQERVKKDDVETILKITK